MTRWILWCIALFCFIIAMPASSAENRNMAVIDILRLGSKADAENNVHALMRAALALNRAGAHPAEGDTDISEIWIAKAKSLSEKMPLIYQYRGRTLGPAYRRGIIAAHGKFTTQQSVNAGQSATVNVVALKGATLGLDVTDDDHQQVCHLTHTVRERDCHWMPTYTGISTFILTNYSDFQDSYFIVIN